MDSFPTITTNIRCQTAFAPTPAARRRSPAGAILKIENGIWMLEASDTRGLSDRAARGSFGRTRRSVKEVIQPQVPLRLPCYDFAPVTRLAFGGLVWVAPVPAPTSGAPSFHGVTGGVYKARERIHRSNADLRLLATPASRSRVADCDPN